MAHFSVTGNSDLSTLDLSTIENGDIKTNDASEFVIKATNGTQYAFYGTFEGGDGNTLPTSGTVTSIVSQDADGNRFVINDLSVPVTDVEHFMQVGNTQGLLAELFAGNDTFNLTAGGENTVFGEAGNDVFNLGATLDAGDSINGGGGSNIAVLNGEYAGLVLNDTTLTGIDKLVLRGNDTYDITTADGTVAAGDTMVVDARQVGNLGTIHFDGTAETDGRFVFYLGGAGSVDVSGGAGNDVFHGAGSGSTLRGGAGNDNFIFGANFDGTDSINGDTGYDVIQLKGDYSAGLTFGADSLVNIDKVDLLGPHSYNLTLSAANSLSGDHLKFDGHLLHGSDTLTFDGAAATGTLIVDGGTGNDTIIGGAGPNNIKGGDGIDTITAGAGFDRFIYTDVHQSTGTQHDVIAGFDADQDHFVLNVAVAAVDAAVTSGTLNAATFNSNLGSAIGASQLHAHDAVLFTASSGTLAGDTFLIVDENGVAGYQSNADLVVQLTGATHLADLSTANFEVGN
jgi:serralysin